MQLFKKTGNRQRSSEASLRNIHFLLLTFLESSTRPYKRFELGYISFNGQPSRVPPTDEQDIGVCTGIKLQRTDATYWKPKETVTTLTEGLHEQPRQCYPMTHLISKDYNTLFGCSRDLRSCCDARYPKSCCWRERAIQAISRFPWACEGETTN